jgi:hypothetical protein
MFRKRSLAFILTLLIILSLTGGPAAARGGDTAPLKASLGTAFTYQGVLKDGSGNPVTDTCEFIFSLWDSASGGTKIGVGIAKSGVTVNHGLFIVSLDFGSSAFAGSARWLEIVVMCASDPGYTTLSPRQELTAAPYALYSLNADKVDGLHASSLQRKYDNIVVVAKSGGDYTTITAALNSITDANYDNPYLVYVAPGIYTERVTMKSYVDIEGAGEEITKITYTGSSTMDTGTVVGANDAELRFLSVENSGGSAYAIAIYNNTASPHLTHLTVRAASVSGDSIGVLNALSSSPHMKDVSVDALAAASNFGVANFDYSSPTMTDMTITVYGGETSTGVDSERSASPVLTDVTIKVSGATDYNYGVYNSQNSPTIQDVRITVRDGNACYGISNAGGASVNVMDTTILTSDGTSGYGIYTTESTLTLANATVTTYGFTNAYGMFNDVSTVTIQNSYIKAIFATTVNYGLYNIAIDYSTPVHVNNSTIQGANNAINSITADTYNFIGASQLIGGVTGIGHFTCAASYDGNLILLDGACN